MKTLTLFFNEISVAKGEEFDVLLTSHGNMGYMWEFNVRSGKATELGMVQEAPKPFDPDKTEIGGIFPLKFRFRAEEAGELVIDAVERQPFNPNKTLARCSFRIDVQ